jgi:acetaldehyde dehydrogenase (acetylating)
MSKKLKTAILGSGLIGTDLMIKIMRSPYLECTLFVGRNLQSKGMAKALSLGVKISDQSIDSERPVVLRPGLRRHFSQGTRRARAYT